MPQQIQTSKTDQKSQPASESFVLFTAEELKEMGLDWEPNISDDLVRGTPVRPLTEGLGFHHDQIKFGETKYNVVEEKIPFTEKISKGNSFPVTPSMPVSAPAYVPYTSSVPHIKNVRKEQMQKKEEKLLPASWEQKALADLFDISLALAMGAITFIAFAFIQAEAFSGTIITSFWTSHWPLFLIYTFVYKLALFSILDATEMGTYGKNLLHLQLIKNGDQTLAKVPSELVIARTLIMLTSLILLVIPYSFDFHGKLTGTTIVRRKKR